MSNSLSNSWKEAIFEESSVETLNKHSNAVISITYSNNSGPQVLEHLRNNRKIILLGQNVVSEEMFLVHHVEEVSGGIGSSFKALVCLQGFGTKATPLQLNTWLLNECIEVDCPTENDIWGAGSMEDFYNLAPAEGTNVRTMKFRALLAIPSFISKTIVDSGASDPKEMGFLVLAACKSFYDLIKDEPEAEQTKKSMIHVLSYLWAASRRVMVRTPYEIASNGEILSWAERLQSNNVRPVGMPQPNPGSIDGPSSAAWGQMAQSMVEVKQALADQVEDRRAERNEKKDKWSKVLESHRDMILNFCTKDGKKAALSPSKELLEVMNCPTLAEAESKVRSIMKSHGIRVKLPLILIKSLYTGDWCNSNIDNPSKLSFFFMNPSSEFDDEENLKLHLRSNEGKGLTDDQINDIMKKDYFIPKNNYELREGLRIGTVFAKCFWNDGLVSNELKAGLQIVIR